MSIEAIIRRDRWIVATSLALVVALSWSFLLAGAGMGESAVEMTGMYYEDPASMDMDSPMMRPAAWTPAYMAVMFVMWWGMMIAMMLPSAAPVVLLAAAINRRADPGRPPNGSTGMFAGGYLLGWGIFSFVAMLVQYGLERSGALSMMRLSDPIIAGGILLAAAAWQLTPWKRTCLSHCRSPVEFLTRRRRSGRLGSLAMGMEHGLYCLGCCWVLMALLFVGGVMNLYWIIGLAVFVLIEKVLPLGRRVGHIATAWLAVWGLGVATGTL